METTKPLGEKLAYGFLAFAAVCVALFFLTRSRPPQVGTSDDVFKTVDALYTALRMEDPKKLDACEKRLHAERDAGKLPASASEHLDAIIAKARKGDWRPAAERLYAFMAAQRREK